MWIYTGGFLLRSICEISDCEKPVVSQGLCNMHRQRYARHGDVNAARPSGWGNGRKHPLYERWRSMRRTAKLAGGHVPEWSDFWTFVRDVGKPPTPTARLYRYDEKKPFGPDTVSWRERVADEMTTTNRLAKNAYMRRYNETRRHILKSAYLKRHYGMTLAEYETLHEAQNGLCAICGEAETAVDKDGRPYLLAVDHCHTTGRVRGLLCTADNRAIGLLKENPDRLRAAIAYLESHAGKDAAA